MEVDLLRTPVKVVSDEASICSLGGLEDLREENFIGSLLTK